MTGRIHGMLVLARRVAAAGLAIALGTTGLAAQGATGTVTGKVTDKAGEAMPGVTVSVAGGQQGAITKADGSYRLVLRAGTYELRARLLGYGTQRAEVTVAAGGSVTKNFTLEKAAAALSAVAVTGTRSEARSVMDAPAPIDVLSPADLRATGRTETAQMLQAAAPSVNFPRASITDGTDHIRPATLRGMGADQVLVLVNGKRRHTSALVNINGSVGRGQAAVDLNAIPASLIDRIEVLRDGAAAQYGSDAIAGVINIILKEGAEGELQTTLGMNLSNYKLLGNQLMTDGEVVQAQVNKGLRGERGFITGGIEYRERGWTNRSLPDNRTSNFFAGDPRLLRSDLMGRITHRQGDAYTRDGVAFVNFGHSLGSSAEFYGNAGFGKREGEAAGFFRAPADRRTVRSLAPDGFLPLITTDITDLSGTLGIKGEANGWKYDLSTVYGGNRLRFGVKNSMNTSLGRASKTQFAAGGPEFKQLTSNFDVAKAFKTSNGTPVRFAAGAEFRQDTYGISAGEPDSWRQGGVPILDGPEAGSVAAPGAQVFPGFRPTDAGEWSRNTVAGYADIESDLTQKLMATVAVRGENYSDFGSTFNYKVAGRYKVSEPLSLRAAYATGFRAPSLHQTYLSNYATNFVNVPGVGNVPFDINTLQVTSALAQQMGAKPLEPETSTHLSGGFAAELAKDLTLTVDFYQIEIADRIVFSGNFISAATRTLLANAGFPGTGARFFANAIDTRTQGADIVANYAKQTEEAGFFRFTGALSFNKTRVTKVAATPSQLAALGESIFDRVERGRFEFGQPQNNQIYSVNWTKSIWTANVRTQRFGKVRTFGLAANGSADNIMQPKWITDLLIERDFTKQTRLSIGADNIFDVYPTQVIAANSNGGTLPFSGFSPFGFNGRHVFARVSYKF